jgi:hypothetical protein
MGGFRGSTEVRRYVPFFQLWTLWGAFSPVGYDEVRGRLDWTRADGRLAAHGYGAFRQYRETETEAPAGFAIRDDSWRIAVGGRYSLSEDLVFSGEYRYEEGYGASRAAGDATAQRFFDGNRYLMVQATAFETFSEFRVGSGRVLGAGLYGGTPVGPATVQAGAMFYKHTADERPTILDLNQARLHLSVELPLGSDPGLSGRRTP